MRGCARAPVRLDPAGGGTDAPPFRIEHGGAVVNFAVQRHAFASAQRLDPGSGILLYAMDLQEGVAAESVGELGSDNRLEFVKAFVSRLVPAGDSLLLLTETDVPPGSGLGGSGALGVAIVAAIDRAYDRERSPLETAILANDIERNFLGYSGGDQDSLGAAFGGINFLEYHRGGAMTPHKISISDDTLRTLEYNSLLVYSGAAHVSASIHEDIKRSYALENSPTVKAMIALREQAQTMAKALESGNLTGYASALGESCRQLYNLHESCDSAEHRRYLHEIDDLILGGKTCGAGGGGFLLVYVKPGRRCECKRRRESLGGLVWPVTIDSDGVTTWSDSPFDADDIERFRQLVRSNDVR
ncbi:MAG: hypothetical protein ACR2NM_08110 [Bythopirellula sp.]